MPKSYNHHDFGSYSPVAELSPYSKIDDERLRDPKFVFRYMLNYVRQHKKSADITNWLDMGCANGEFLYFLNNNEPSWRYTGVDLNPDFLKVARKLLAEYPNTQLLERDIFGPEINEKADIVSCTGTFQIFPDPTEILNILIEQVNPSGMCLIDGCFNPFDISMNIRYLDESRREAENIWRCDFNHHSEKMIRRILEARSDVASFSFFYPTMDTEIAKQPEAPHINMWTEPRPDGGYNIINGMGLYFNPRFLVINKV